MPTLFLFPGAHKTGSSLLQRALEICRSEIEAEGLAIARRGKYFEHLHLDLRLSTQEFSTKLEEVTERLPLVFETSAMNSDLILSVENVFGEFGARPYGAIERVLDNLTALFPRHEIRSTFYIRRQDTFLESYYVQCIHKGVDLGWPEFWERYGSVTIRWKKMIAQLERKLGQDNSQVRAFEEIKNGPMRFIRSFFEDLRSLDAESLTNKCRGKLTRTNLSLSQQGIDIVRAGFKHIDERRERERFAKHMQALYSVNTGTRFQMPDELRREIAKMYVAENQEICDKIGALEKIRSHYAFENELA